MHELEARVAIVTGAARGLGLVIAERFIAAGARVVLADVLEDEGRAAANKFGAAARFSLLDVTREADWARVVDETLELLAPVAEQTQHLVASDLGVPEAVQGFTEDVVQARVSSSPRMSR